MKQPKTTKKILKKTQKKTQKKKDSNETNFDEILQQEKPEDLIIPNTFIKNIYLGDLIDILIDIKYDEEFKKLQEIKENSKNIFRYIPIKIALIGQDFSGKKTQAKILSQNFPFKIYDLVDLVKDALSFLSSSHESKTNFLLSNTQLTSNEKKTAQSHKCEMNRQKKKKNTQK